MPTLLDTSQSYADLLSQITPEVSRPVLVEAAAEAASAGLDKVAAQWWWRVVNQQVADSLTRVPSAPFTVDDPGRHTRYVPIWDRLPFATVDEAASTAVTVWAGWPASSASGRSYLESLGLTFRDVPVEMWASVEHLVPWVDVFSQQGCRVRGLARDLADLRDTVSFEEARYLAGVFPWSAPGKVAQWVRLLRQAGGRLEDLEVWVRTEDFIGKGRSTGGYVFVPDWSVIEQRYADSVAADCEPGFAPAAAAAGFSVAEAAESGRGGHSVAAMGMLAGLQDTTLHPLTQGIRKV